jgi:hypothetical protein
MDKLTDTPEKPKNPNERREATDRAFAEIIESERKARQAKNLRLRSLRVARTGGEPSP